MDKRKTVNYAKYGYIFSIPFVIAYLIFSLYPVLYTVVIGFTDLHGLTMKITDMRLMSNPFQNYIDVLSAKGNGSFRLAFFNTVIMWVCNFIPQLFVSLLLTAWFTDDRTKIKGQGLFKVLVYLPNIITAASVAILFQAFLSYPIGPLNAIRLGFLNFFDKIFHFGFDGKTYNFLNNKNFTRGTVSFIQFWMWYGNTMVLLIAGVIGIDPEIFEAAQIDGANRRQTFFRITLPCIRTILLYVLVTSMIGGLNMFDIPQLLNRGGPDGSTATTAMYIYTQAFRNSEYMYNRASAASIIMFVIIMILTVILFYILRDKDEVELRKIRKRERKALKR